MGTNRLGPIKELAGSSSQAPKVPLLKEPKVSSEPRPNPLAGVTDAGMAVIAFVAGQPYSVVRHWVGRAQSNTSRRIPGSTS